MANLTVRPVDRHIVPYWKAQEKLNKCCVEGLSADLRTTVRIKRLESEAEALGFNLFDEMVRQCEGERDADE